MPTPFTQYAKVKDKYCLAYFGPSQELLEQLVAIRPEIEKRLPGLEVYVSCRSELMYAVQEEERIVPREKLHRYNFGYIRQIKNSLIDNPVQNLLRET